MSDPPIMMKSSRLSAGTPGPSLSSRQRPTDDFLANIQPATIVEALTAPTGSLHSCLDDVSVSEREFALRTALASQRIWEWLNEMNAWFWPVEGGSEGFQNPNRTQRKLFTSSSATEDTFKQYIGSLPAQDVPTYEGRVEDIKDEIDALHLDEIKNHVMKEYIMPLSRPNTLIPDPKASFLTALAASYNKMEEIQAVVTVIVMQTLPNLARLTRLLQVWHLRLRVLRLVNPFLEAIKIAEVSLGENWEAVSQASQHMVINKAAHYKSLLSQAEFESRKADLAKKIAEPGITLDSMLDYLENSPDTLPEEWLSRMEDIERAYGEWIATCERKIMESEWAKGIESRAVSPSPLPSEAASQTAGAPLDDLSHETVTPARIRKPSKMHKTPSKSHDGGADLSDSTDDTQSSVFEFNTPSDDESEPCDTSINPISIVINNDEANNEGAPLHETQSPKTPLNSGFKSKKDRLWLQDEFNMDDAMTTVDEETEEEDDLELPPLRNSTRRGSTVSQTSTIVHSVSKYYDLSSDLPEVNASPAVRKSRLREATFPDDESLSSSPPRTEYDNDGSVLLDSPIITSVDDDAFFKSPADDSFFDDEYDESFSMADFTGGPLPGGPLRRENLANVEEYSMLEKMTKLLDSIPAAKIRLAPEKPRVNLNPPDFKNPQLKKSTTEPIRRSASGLSNRTTTPSFTLTPVKGPRSRHRGHHDIKVYHLSRSNGDAPIKLFIRCVGPNGERVMVRVGGGWADLAEYLKEYASHHGSRSTGKEKAKVEVTKLQRDLVSSPPSRPPSVAGDKSPMTPLNVRKARRRSSMGTTTAEPPRPLRPKTPANVSQPQETPSSDQSTRSRSSSHSWVEDESSFLGLAGPTGKNVEMSEESKAWVESVKEKVRMVSGDMRNSASDRFGEIGKAGATKRVFRKGSMKL